VFTAHDKKLFEQERKLHSAHPCDDVAGGTAGIGCGVVVAFASAADADACSVDAATSSPPDEDTGVQHIDLDKRNNPITS